MWLENYRFYACQIFKRLYDKNIENTANNIHMVQYEFIKY